MANVKEIIHIRFGTRRGNMWYI